MGRPDKVSRFSVAVLAVTILPLGSLAVALSGCNKPPAADSRVGSDDPSLSGTKARTRRDADPVATRRPTPTSLSDGDSPVRNEPIGGQSPGQPLPSLALPDALPADLPEASGNNVPRSGESPVAAAPDIQARAIELARRREELDRTVWKGEVIAQQYERALVRLWDRLLAQQRAVRQEEARPGDAWQVLADIAFGTITLGRRDRTDRLEHGIQIQHFRGGGEQLSPDQWREQIGALRAAGWVIDQSEWHHAQFTPPSAETPATSVIAMALYGRRLTEPGHGEPQRFVLRGTLSVRWRREMDEQGVPLAAAIDTQQMQLLLRPGPAAFREIVTVDRTSAEGRSGVQPIVARDLNGDGLSEILVVGCNRLLWNEGAGAFRELPLCKYPEPLFEAGLVADMNGDAHLDLLVPGRRGDLLLYLGDSKGTFATRPIGKVRSGGPLMQPQVITAGDIDGDGDLDVWIGQYKISYVGGQMPHPYYDANDGFPAYLLLNDGRGRFTPATEEAGLAAKRYRRSYGGSFVDLDDDADLDLLVVSDFAGVDVYQNDGSGYFLDLTDKWIDQRHLFGMSVSFADFNVDGRTDCFVTGMASTTARRLEGLKAGRRDRPEVHMMRRQMGYGNRMYVATGDGFRQPAIRDQVARTGWSWGSAALDFDNDGDPDLFVANGHSSGKSTKDHCTHFWCHDIYDGDSKPSAALAKLFADELQGYFDRSESWDGYQKNALLMNREGKEFVEIGFLLGLGHEFDGRAVVRDDVDGDGRVDLLVVEDRWRDGQLLHVYRNELPGANHWIGVRVANRPARSPIGCQVIVRTDDRVFVQPIVTGDSIHAQNETVAHFGLGKREGVTAIEVRWPDGHSERIEHPAVDRYHRM